MERLVLWYILVVFGIFLSACSQILLKKSAEINHKSFFFSILNWRVITAYAIFFGSLLLNITAMRKGVNLKDLPILESFGYIFVPLLSFFVLREEIEKKTVWAIFFIIIGITVFYL